MLESLLIFVVQTAVLHAFFFKLKWRERREYRPDIGHLSPEQVKRRALWANGVGNLFYVGAMLVGMIGWAALSYGFWIWSAPKVEGARFVLRPTAFYPLFAAIPAGIALMGPIGLAAFRVLFWPWYHLWVACGEAHFGVPLRQIRWQMYVIFVWVVPLCCDWEAAWMESSTVFTGDALQYRGFAAARPTIYPYSEIVAVEGAMAYIPHPERIFPEPNFRIVFRDGTVWKTTDGGHAPTGDEQPAVAFAAARAGVPIRWVAKID